MKIWISALFVFFLAGCASHYDSLYPHSAASKYGCQYTSDSEYNCPNSIPGHFKAANNCTWVDSYVKADGTYVSSHMRCKISEKSAYPSASGSNCHYVSGYRRKNGTYVSGYTRCR